MGLDREQEIKKAGEALVDEIQHNAKQEVANAVSTRFGIKPRRFLNKFLGSKKVLKEKVGSFLGSLKERQEAIRSEKVHNTLNDIIEVLKERNKFEKDQAKDKFKNQQDSKRNWRESLLEGVGKVGGVLSAAKSIIPQFSDLWSGILKFLKFTFLGGLFTNIMKFFGDFNKNKDKIKLIGRFLKDWWPALTGLAITFLTPLGGLVTSSLALIAWATIKMGALFLAHPWILALAGLGAAGMWGWNKLKNRDNQDSSIEMPDAKEGLNLWQRLFYQGGGFAKGTDTIPAMLSPGEFVMSAGAVKQFGVGMLESMNAMGGGTNRPTKMGGMVYAQEGGLISQRDIAALTAISALEAGTPQGRADVAQSIYNRLGDKMYGNSIFDIITADRQYQPAYIDPTSTSGQGTITSPVWRSITDKRSALGAMQSYYQRRYPQNEPPTITQLSQLYDDTLSALKDITYQQRAALHVGGRTEFLGFNVKGDDVVWRGSQFDNRFFSEYGSGMQLQRGAIPSPLARDDKKSILELMRRQNNQSSINAPISSFRHQTIVLPPIDATVDEDQGAMPGSRLPTFQIVADNPHREEMLESLEIQDLVGV